MTFLDTIRSVYYPSPGDYGQQRPGGRGSVSSGMSLRGAGGAFRRCGRREAGSDTYTSTCLRTSGASRTKCVTHASFGKGMECVGDYLFIFDRPPFCATCAPLRNKSFTVTHGEIYLGDMASPASTAEPRRRAARSRKPGMRPPGSRWLNRLFCLGCLASLLPLYYECVSHSPSRAARSHA
jgi:hypothetical protein